MNTEHSQVGEIPGVFMGGDYYPYVSFDVNTAFVDTARDFWLVILMVEIQEIIELNKYMKGVNKLFSRFCGRHLLVVINDRVSKKPKQLTKSQLTTTNKISA